MRESAEQRPRFTQTVCSWHVSAQAFDVTKVADGCRLAGLSGSLYLAEAEKGWPEGRERCRRNTCPGVKVANIDAGRTVVMCMSQARA